MGRRIGIVGAGGIGCVVGGLLTKAGHDVTLMDQWPEHVEALKRQGLRLSGTCGDHQIPVKALHLHEMQRITEPFDAVFVAVKSYDTEWATALGVAYLARPDGVVVDFQNGVNDERVAAVAGRERTLGCVILIAPGLYDVEADVSRDARSRAGGRPSLLQDVMRGRRTEIEYLNGYVVAEGKRAGVPTPINEAVVDLYRRHGVGTLRPDPKNLEPLLKLLPA